MLASDTPAVQQAFIYTHANTANTVLCHSHLMSKSCAKVTRSSNPMTFVHKNIMIMIWSLWFLVSGKQNLRWTTMCRVFHFAIVFIYPFIVYTHFSLFQGHRSLLESIPAANGQITGFPFLQKIKPKRKKQVSCRQCYEPVWFRSL